jgi:uncharacterized protein GlcG (DUF336 family)
MSRLNLSQATAAIEAALACAREHKFRRMSVAVLDAGGHLIAVQRDDGASYLRCDIAYAKAWGALGMGMGSRGLLQLFEKLPAFVTALGPVSQGRLVPAPGGVLIADGDGEILGAIGLSGDTSDNDEVCALAAIKAIGLVAIPGRPDEG